MTKVELNAEMMEVLVFATTIPEMTVYRKDKAKDYFKDFPLVKQYPDVFDDGFQLRKAMLLVFSADSHMDYEHDTANYDEKAAYLNQKYGRIAVLTSDPIGDGGFALGLIGNRTAPFGRITIQTKGEKPVIRFPQEEIDAEDALMRKEMKNTRSN